MHIKTELIFSNSPANYKKIIIQINKKMCGNIKNTLYKIKRVEFLS